MLEIRFTLPKDTTKEEAEQGVKEATDALNKLDMHLRKIISEVNKLNAHPRLIVTEVLLSELTANIRLPILSLIGAIERLKHSILEAIKEGESIIKRREAETRSTYIG